MTSITEKSIRRFWAKVRKSDGCWEWIASKYTSGYGYFRHSRRQCIAHRVAYETYVGPIPIGFQVLHRCDNPACVNPDHLWVGTHADNMRDKKEKGRSVKGEQVRGSKLNAEQVVEIFHDRRSKRELALAYGVRPDTIKKIKERKTWCHLGL